MQALKYYTSFIYKSSFKYILTPGTQTFPNPFPCPSKGWSKQIPAGPGEGGNGQRGASVGTVWDGLGQKRGFGCWKLAAFYRHLDQPAHIPFPQRSSTRIILTGCAWSPFPGGWCRSDTRLCPDLRPGTFQGPAFPAIPSRASGQAWAGTSPGSPLLGHGTEVTETAAGKAGEIKREQLLPKRLVGRPCTDAEPGAARPQPPRGSPGSRDSSRPFSHSLHPSIHPFTGNAAGVNGNALVNKDLQEPNVTMLSKGVLTVQLLLD